MWPLVWLIGWPLTIGGLVWWLHRCERRRHADEWNATVVAWDEARRVLRQEYRP